MSWKTVSTWIENNVWLIWLEDKLMTTDCFYYVTEWHRGTIPGNTTSNYVATKKRGKRKKNHLKEYILEKSLLLNTLRYYALTIWVGYTLSYL